ncbi:MAG: hypothetical protein ACP5N2_00995 [Candidatus Nanoarchaeia archaeon]
MMKLATNENLDVLTSATFAERQNTLKVVGTEKKQAGSQVSPPEYGGRGVQVCGMENEELYQTLNSKPYFRGTSRSEQDLGDFLNVYQPSPAYRS